ncbi:MULTISPECIES: tetraacyldisaccharide 4'-kinase [unclassified Halomonas]|uniref:tetraacyldisaccharide 4'-kinase n=1 Tax=unclassified Halomonas TaxID=2609666 RepID=UPI0006DBBC1D|nr:MULTISPECIES: tetraacyldisaccharide 4'-kinase [unclassified Halomonas]KPQ22788.1 MAG: tetraacyldisaccharide 4'-kinase LpxK [Halomonas sp. HL-93]SBR49549.1 lipid-A-disaccharide kinase [Halomonas sp. HL-93]SNY96425.1 lipid-A-disaccharide kinase [Halomonas sp. hl-4]
MKLAERWLAGAYQGSRWLWPLRPLGRLYQWLMQRRANQYERGKRTVWRVSVPVIIVGNITLGGTGKSPLVAWLGRRLVAQGWSPGIVSRGYGGSAKRYPLRVTTATPVTESGDEPLMLAQQTGLPVMVDPQRGRAAAALVEAGCDVIISDDGLQHLALARDIELVVIDGARGLGNGCCLPAGPLREPSSRLKRADAVIVNGDTACELPVETVTMRLTPCAWRRIHDGQRFPLMPLPFTGPVNGLAAIGNPQRFFAVLASLGVEGEWHPLADHQPLTEVLLNQWRGRPLVMTAKDAVKCQAFAPPDSWVLDVEASLPPDFEHWLADKLSALT